MSKEERKVPELRFKGFHDDWEQRKLGDVAEQLEYGLNASATEYDGLNKYIRITDIDDKNRKFDKGAITSPNIELHSSDNYLLREGDILFARTGASVGKTYIYDINDGKVYYAGFLIRARINSNTNSDFIFQNTLTKKYYNFVRITSQRSGQPGINANEYKNYKISMPQIDEQDSISDFLKTLDDLIVLHQRKIQILDNMYSLFIREIYPKKHEVVPKMRFSEYSSHWVKITLESLLKEFSIKSSIENEYQILSSTNSGMEFRRGRVSGSSNRGYKIIDNGDLVLSPQNLWLGNININKLGKGLVSPSYKTFSIDKVDGEFLEPQLRTKRMLNTFENVSTQGASVVRRNLDMDLFKQIIVKVPTNQEKEKIANLLNLIMNLIKHYDSKLMKLQTIKTEYLKKMFL